MIKQVDINGDGEISYSEFEKMMERMITKCFYQLNIQQDK